MTMSSRANIARVVATLVSRRTTARDELPELVASVHDALRRLDEPAELHLPEPEREDEIAVRPPPRRKRALPAPDEVETEAVAAPAPRLLRRADVVPASPAAEAPASLAAPTGLLRGIVKWFDPRTRRAALQLPGISGDVAVEPALLDQMAIPRLYRGQEVEATLAAGEIPRVVRLALPGGAWQVSAAGGIVHGRQAKPVVVELKREALRRVAARAEAELVLGPGRHR
jgi:hypothetical protein